jgi:mono/diheme cytochrome c family protein
MKKVFLAVTMLLVLFLVACGGDNTTGNGSGDGAVAAAGDPQQGEVLYNQACIACHGEAGVGIEGLGKPFPTSDFIRTHSDQELLDFIKQGRPVGHPDNTTGVDMPPKGGNPALSDEDILDIIAYIRTLQD